MSSDLLGTAITGLRVSQSALSTTGHNISNANVEGYSRQVVQAETNPATPIGGFYVGNGARVASIERQVDEFLVAQLRRDTTLYHELDVYQTNISQLDALLSDSSTGLSGAMASFFASVQNGADDPTSIPARQLIVSEAENLADRFNTIYDRLTAISNGVNSALQSNVSEVNALVDNIANLNRKLADALQSGNGNPNDLLDQRDQAMKELSKYISFQAYDQGNGELNILIGSGQNLVVGSEARKLTVVAQEDNPELLDVAFVGANGSPQLLNTSIFGGEIGGLFQFRDEALSETFNKMGQIAIVMADTFNEQHQRGLDLDNNYGANFFFDINDIDIARSRVVADTQNSPPDDRVLHLNITDSSQLSLSDYRLEMVNDGLYTVTRLSDGEEVARDLLPGGFPFSVEFDGLELVFERGTFQSGDEFILQPTRRAARDFSAEIARPESIAFASPVLTDSSLSNQGNAEISAGSLLSQTDADGNPLPLLATPGEMDPPLLIRFLSETSYEILDNSDPGNPVPLDPPMSNLRYIPGMSNTLFSEDPGQTLVQMNGTDIGLPVGAVPVVGGGAVLNGYDAETLTFTRAPASEGLSPVTYTVTTSADASARTTASELNNIEGVNASASSYAEISSTSTLSASSPLQITLNGEDLIEYEFDSGSGTFVVASNVPDPSVDEAAFNDYLAARINENSQLQSLGIFAKAAADAGTGAEEVRIYSSEGDDLFISLEADAGAPDTLNVSDGNNPAVALSGNGAGVTSAIAVGGTIDVHLDDQLSLSTTPGVSALFGDSAATDFAQRTYLGIQASISGSPQAGDVFTIDFNTDAASDNRNALAMVNLETLRTVDGGVSSFSDTYASLVESIGIETASNELNRDAAEQVLEQSEQLRDSVSGVNLDEEAANLIRFEQLYAANTQVISVARDLFDRLINAF